MTAKPGSMILLSGSPRFVSRPVGLTHRLSVLNKPTRPNGI
jgi:hypothetical protein